MTHSNTLCSLREARLTFTPKQHTFTGSHKNSVLRYIQTGTKCINCWNIRFWQGRGINTSLLYSISRRLHYRQRQVLCARCAMGCPPPAPHLILNYLAATCATVENNDCSALSADLSKRPPNVKPAYHLLG